MVSYIILVKGRILIYAFILNYYFCYQDFLYILFIALYELIYFSFCIYFTEQDKDKESTATLAATLRWQC